MADKCNYCGTTFESVSPGLYLGSARSGIGDSILKMKKGCDKCGIPVCFDCAAAAADKKGMRGHCICPNCGENLD